MNCFTEPFFCKLLILRHPAYIPYNLVPVKSWIWVCEGAYSLWLFNSYFYFGSDKVVTRHVHRFHQSADLIRFPKDKVWGGYEHINDRTKSTIVVVECRSFWNMTAEFMFRTEGMPGLLSSCGRLFRYICVCTKYFMIKGMTVVFKEVIKILQWREKIRILSRGGSIKR